MDILNLASAEWLAFSIWHRVLDVTVRLLRFPVILGIMGMLEGVRGGTGIEGKVELPSRAVNESSDTSGAFHPWTNGPGRKTGCPQRKWGLLAGRDLVNEVNEDVRIGGKTGLLLACLTW